MKQTVLRHLLCVALTSSMMGGCGQLLLSGYAGPQDTDVWVDDLEDGEDTGDTFVNEEEQETDEEPPVPECTHEGFSSTASQTTLNETNPTQIRFIHRSVNTSGYPNDELQFVSFQGNPYNGPASPGTYSVEGMNTADCGLCLLVLADCNGPDCSKTFFARSGDVKIVAMEGIGGVFSADLQDVVLEEVTVDPSTYRSTPVVNGETWCLDGVSIEDPYILPGF